MAIRRLYGPDFNESGGMDQDYVASLAIPFAADSLDEAMFGTMPNDTSLAENTRKRRWQPWGGAGKYIVTATFEGADSSRLDNDDAFSWEFDASFAERRMESNPNIQALITKYGGQVQDDGTIFWPLTYSAQTGSSGAFGSAKKTQTKNPLFGRESFIEVNSIFRMTKLKSRESPDLAERLGSIKNDLPVNVNTPAGRNWMIASIKVTERGSIVSEMEEWLISAPGRGWDPDIDSLIAR